MKKNLGTTDRLVRIIVSALLFSYYFLEVPEGIVKWVILVLAGILGITALVGTCPLYSLFGLSSLKKNNINRIL
ncbi:DUF2892 domain-containing protein [Pollutibacter soli]|uniref:YgaP family membrane protein n=1 Tax=Pollutibacter soli TaxID=3034157 RepID=UPI003013F7B1